jgi:transposase
MKSRAKMVVIETTSEGATSARKSIINLSSVTTVGLDLAKHVFQVHCIDASGRVVVAKAIRRNKLLEFVASLPRCLVGLEAFGSAHHWARELIELGHDARMMPPAYVKPYIRRQKNDAADVAAICEALAPLVVQLRNLDESIARLERTIAKLAQQDETARRLMSIPGLGPITASAMAATVQDTSSSAGPREFAALLGLTPKQNSSGGKPKLGRISKMGNRNLRKLLVVGAHAVLFHRKPHTDPLRMWAKKLIEKKPFKLVAVALANKMARIAFAILRSKTVYREIPA